MALVLAATGCSTTFTATEGIAASVRSLGRSAKSPDGSWEEHAETGSAALEAGRDDDSVAHLSEALRLLGEIEDADSLAVARVDYGLGTAYTEQRRLPEAEHHFRQALAIEERVLGPDHVDGIKTLEALAIIRDYQGHFAEAEQRFCSVIGRLEKKRGAGHGDVAWAKANLAVNLGYQGRLAEAEAHITHCVAIRERALPPDHPWRIGSLRRYAQVLRARGKHEAAAAIKAQLPREEEAASAP